jgi:aminobenzoyl-glutamate utilization protein B
MDWVGTSCASIWSAQRSHRVITNGGDQTNVIPEQARFWWFFRESDRGENPALFEKAKRIRRRAQIMDRYSPIP